MKHKDYKVSVHIDDGIEVRDFFEIITFNVSFIKDIDKALEDIRESLLHGGHCDDRCAQG